MKLRAAKLRGIGGILQSQPILRSLSFGGFSAPLSPQQAVEYSATENKKIPLRRMAKRDLHMHLCGRDALVNKIAIRSVTKVRDSW